MKRRTMILFPLYIAIFTVMFFAAFAYENAVDTVAENTLLSERHCIVIDAGHGGIDGGATSCSGVLESKINLDIAIRLNDLFHLLGIDTTMIRTGDYSVHTQGQTISQQKISDLKNRVKITNSTKNVFLVSIHQNYYPDSRYFGPQIFYANRSESKAVAEKLQSALNTTLAHGCNRTQKQAKGIYLMENITCNGILIEGGFLSNPEEEKRLLSPSYQKNMCCVLASVLANHLFSQQLS